MGTVKTVKIEIPFGKEFIEVKIPKANFFESLEPFGIENIKNVQEAIKKSLNNPIESKKLIDISKDKKNACILVFDHTRNVPNREILTSILGILSNAGIKKKDTKILIATGTHRATTTIELKNMLGEKIVKEYKIINHDCYSSSVNVEIGKTKDGLPVRINKNFINSDLRILTGTIESHPWAGLAGGCKGICPGIAFIETIMLTHNPVMIKDESVISGRLQGNKFYEKTVEIAKMAEPHFICNAVLDKYKKPVAFFSGDPVKAHIAGSKFCNDLITLNYNNFADIVIIGSGGYPLDSTLYQSVKGMAQAYKIVRKRGVIIVIAECGEGIGSNQFRELLFDMKDPEVFIEDLTKSKVYRLDQWQAQDLAKVIAKAKVLYYSKGIKDEDFPGHIIQKINSVEEGINISLNICGRNSKISVIKDAPYVIPRVK